MRRNYFLLLVMAWVLLTFAGGAVAPPIEQAKELERIPDFAHALTARGATVKDWTVFVREELPGTIDRLQFERFAEKERKQFADYSWKAIKRNDGVVSWIGRTAEKGETTDRFTIAAYPQGNRFRSVLLYQVRGESFDEQKWPSQRKNLRQAITEIFHGQETIFSCVRALRHDTMGLGLLEEGDRYLKLFSAAPVERLSEKTFVSLSAYTKAWNNNVNSGNRKMNIQVALRRDGDRTMITIGSPIITLEY
ncbi:MAG: YwmB family TATA-box binding protein [Sporolactobacillus sp.]|nr:YwmB family TATA-box binding protein [Sporolactobacillus sp.]